MDLLTRFNDFLGRHRLLAENRPVLVAVSGGLDSVVLAHLFRHSGRPFALAHVNFQLRGAESEGDAVFVRDLAAHWEVDYFETSFETRDYSRQNGLSMQMAARDLRYAWFDMLRETHDFEAVAVAHTLNDSVETALLNFVRGTGLAGLSGIALRNGAIVRPLLFATRPEVEAYALAHEISWREDSSNQSDAYTRNFLRHHVLPLLEELNPGFLHTAERNLKRVRGARRNYSFLLREFAGFAEKDGLPDGELSKARLTALPARFAALIELLAPYGFTEEQCRQLHDSWDHSGLEWQSPDGYRLINDRTSLLLVSAANTPAPSLSLQADDLLVALPDGSRLVLMPAAVAGPFPDGRETVLVDAAKLEFPLVLRPWQPGDRFQPLGLGGHTQKLQDYFINLKLSKLEKEHIWLLLNGDGVVIWVIGCRPDERFRITPASRQAVKIHWTRP